MAVCYKCWTHEKNIMFWIDIHCSHPVKSGITPLLSTDIFRAYVIPELEHIFLVRDTHIRLVLLKHFSLYAHLFGADTLRQVIFPQVRKFVTFFNMLVIIWMIGWFLCKNDLEKHSIWPWLTIMFFCWYLISPNS